MGRFAVHAAVVLLVLTAAYWQAAGQGFISDDFRWILESRVRQAADLYKPFVDTTGFFRPMVSLAFAAIETFAGIDPGPYGTATFLLTILCAVAVAGFARALSLPVGAAILAGSLWILNPHGINMAILWISGLTALCLVLFGTLAAVAVRRGYWLAGTLLFFAALLSKEEALLFPVPLLLMARRRDGMAARRGRLALGLGVAEVLYFVMRVRSDAMMPADAPALYRFTVDIGDVLSNALQYADRSLTLAAVVLVIVAAVVRARPRLEAAEREAILTGIVWLAAGFGITLFLPVRSSLYAFSPSIGGVIAASALAAALWREASPARRRALQILAIILPLCLAPVLRSRTARWTELMRVSRITLEAVTPAMGSAPAVLFVDDRGRRDNLHNAFGSLLPDALELFSGRRPEVWLVPAPPDASSAEIIPLPSGIESGWRYRDGRVERIDAAPLAGSAAFRMR